MSTAQVIDFVSSWVRPSVEPPAEEPTNAIALHSRRATMRRIVVSFVVVSVLLLALPAMAQDYPRWEAFGGFSYANVDLGVQRTLLGVTTLDQNYNGLQLAFSYNPHPNLRLILLDFGIQFQPVDVFAGLREDLIVSQALFGPQFTLRSQKATAFVHALAGVTDTDLILPLGVELAELVRKNNFVLGFGGGLDVNWNQWLAIRVFQADYLPTRVSGTWESNFRLGVGVVFKFGGSP